ncbi:hypothetical protein [Halovulum sp. GXIMD14793]
MTPDHPDILTVKKTTLTEAMKADHSKGKAAENYYKLFCFRWEGGEIAEDTLIVEMDVYSETDDHLIRVDGKDYVCDLELETVTEAQEFCQNEGLNPEYAHFCLPLRYRIEFDAFPHGGNLHTGGNWVWGNGAFRGEKRQPEEFMKAWGVAKDD